MLQAHLEHLVHADHVGDVPSKWLAEISCVLPDKAKQDDVKRDGSCVVVLWCLHVAVVGFGRECGVEAGGAAHPKHLVHAGHA